VEKILCGLGPHKLYLVTQREKKRRERREKREKMKKREEKREKEKTCVCDQNQNSWSWSTQVFLYICEIGGSGVGQVVEPIVLRRWRKVRG
jgi:hypothetical protein